MKSSGIKYQIEQKLLEKNWEIIKIEKNFDWWDDENWLIQFKYDNNITLYICFIIDPQFESTRGKGEQLWEVKASTEFPKDWNDNQSTITSLYLSSRKFENRLNDFIAELEKFKKAKTTNKSI